MKEKKDMVTKGIIIGCLQKLGIRPDTNLIVHSSLKSFGYVDGGAETVVDALMSVITQGTLILPSFNHNKCYDEGELFDIRTTPTTNGAIPEAFRKRPGVIRSMNPTHAYAIYGKDAEAIAKRHEASDAMGKGSPLDYLYEHDGCVLLLGVGYTRNTFHHYVETMEKSPCLFARGEEYDVIDETGSVRRARTWSWREHTCPIDDSAIYAPLIQPYDRRITIGSCEAIFFSMKDAYRVISAALREGLDGNPGCSMCETRPRQCEYTVPECRK